MQQINEFSTIKNAKYMRTGGVADNDISAAKKGK